MSRLGELMEELCPDGVKFAELGTLCQTITAPKKLTKKEYKESGIYPIIDQGKKFIVGYTNDRDAVLNNGEYIIFGDHTREIKYVNFPFAQGADGIKIIKSNDTILPKFLFHAMLNLKIPNRGYNRHWSLTSSMVIPCPPFRIQEEIVSILDHFSEYTTELIAELGLEFAKRQEQYQYYKDALFTLGDDVEYIPLKNLAVNHDAKRRPIAKGKRDAGIYPYYGASGVVDYVKNYIFDGDYLLVSEDGANLLARNTPIAFSITGKAWVNNHAHILQFPDISLQKYVEFYLNNIDLTKYISAAAQPKLTQENLNNILIPKPPLERIKHVVAILDRFDALCNDLTSGLPAEIEARKKQYEYYRDKLLTFKEAVQ